MTYYNPSTRPPGGGGGGGMTSKRPRKHPKKSLTWATCTASWENLPTEKKAVYLLVYGQKSAEKHPTGDPCSLTQKETHQKRHTAFRKTKEDCDDDTTRDTQEKQHRTFERHGCYESGTSLLPHRFSCDMKLDLPTRSNGNGGGEIGFTDDTATPLTQINMPATCPRPRG